MRITKRQKDDLECVKWFIPDWVDWQESTEKDEKSFLEYSERGLHKDKINHFFYKQKWRDGFNALIQGKRWRGIHVKELWEKGAVEGTIGKYEIMESLPAVVARYVAKEWNL